MGRLRRAGLVLAVTLTGCAGDATPSEPTTPVEVGEAFLAAVYDGDTETFERLSDADLAEVRFFSAFVGRLGGVTTSVSCEEPRAGVTPCRVTGTDQVVAALDPDAEVLELWDLEITDLLVTDATFSTILPSAAEEYYRVLFETQPDFLDACGDFAGEGDPIRCAELALAGVDEEG